MRTTYGSRSSLNEDALQANDCDESPLIGDSEGSTEVDRASVEEMASICRLVRPNFQFRDRIRDIPNCQLCFVCYLLVALVVFSVCFCVNTHYVWGIFAPVVVAVVLFGALLYRKHREGRVHFADSLLACFDNCCADEPVQSTWLSDVPRYD